MNCPYCHRQDCPLCENFLVYLRFRLGDQAENELALWWRKNGKDDDLITEAEQIFATPKEELTTREARAIWLPWTHLQLCFFCDGAIGEGYRKGNGRLGQPFWEEPCPQEDMHAHGLCGLCTNLVRLHALQGADDVVTAVRAWWKKTGNRYLSFEEEEAIKEQIRGLESARPEFREAA